MKRFSVVLELLITFLFLGLCLTGCENGSNEPEPYTPPTIEILFEKLAPLQAPLRAYDSNGVSYILGPDGGWVVFGSDWTPAPNFSLDKAVRLAEWLFHTQKDSSVSSAAIPKVIRILDSYYTAEFKLPGGGWNEYGYYGGSSQKTMPPCLVYEYQF